MLYPRLIPCLLIKNNGLVKTVNFQNPKYVGDPINAVKIFNEKEVDELMVLDIDATAKHAEPDYKMIESLAHECHMPLCYGGGIRTVECAKKIFSLGVEKIAINSIALEYPDIVSKIAEQVGAQSVVVILDIKKNPASDQYEIWSNNGQKNTKKCPLEFAMKLENLGAGEVVMNSIDHDGKMNGYDFVLADKIRQSTRLPLTILGGASSLNDIGLLIKRYGIIGAAAGSLFVFKGVYRAVLINYPNKKEKDELIKQYYAN